MMKNLVLPLGDIPIHCYKNWMGLISWDYPFKLWILGGEEEGGGRVYCMPLPIGWTGVDMGIQLNAH